MASIDDFKSNLIGGGARANQYRVVMTTPTTITTGLDAVRTQFLVKATSLPGQTIPEVTVNFRGRQLFLAGDRTFETWTTTIINDTDFMVRNAMERERKSFRISCCNPSVSGPHPFSLMVWSAARVRSW